MSHADLQITKDPPGLFPEDLKSAEQIADHVRLLMRSEHQPEKDDGGAIVDYLRELISWSASLVEARTNCLLKKLEAEDRVRTTLITSSQGLSVSIIRDMVQARTARYMAAHDHIERLEAHLSRAIEAYRSILSALKADRERQMYSGHGT